MTTSNNQNLKKEKGDINLKESIKILEPKNILVENHGLK